jgi:hypothetical protein
MWPGNTRAAETYRVIKPAIAQIGAKIRRRTIGTVNIKIMKAPHGVKKGGNK